MAEKELNSSNPFEDVETWLQTVEDEAVPVAAIRMVIAEALKTHQLGRLSIQTAGWMLNFAIDAEQKRIPLSEIALPDVMAMMAKELKLEEILGNIRPDSTKSTIFTKG